MPTWEFVLLSFADDLGEPGAEMPAAYYCAQYISGVYTFFCCGLEEQYVGDHDVYHQVLYAAFQRAQKLGAHTLHMGMDAATPKRHMGAKPKPQCAYIQMRDDFDELILTHHATNARLNKSLANIH